MNSSFAVSFYRTNKRSFKLLSTLKRKREDSDVTPARLSELVNSLSIENERLLTEVESLPMDNVLALTQASEEIALTQASEELLRQKLVYAERQQFLLEQKVEGLMSIVEEKQRRICLLEKNRRI